MDKVNVTTLLATRGLNLRVVVSERTDPKMHRIGWIWEQLRWWAYSKADRIVVQTQGALRYFLPKFQGKLTVIPNPVVLSPPDVVSSKRQPINPLMVAMGRLSEEKGFDFLLRAFARLKDQYPNWALMIIGEGPLRATLESLRDELRLSDRVLLPGQVKNPFQVLKEADLFVVSSHYEGFPNALLEAMACGLPAISFDCPSGPREIIRDGIDGILVQPGDVSALAAAMKDLMSDETKRKRLGLRALETTGRFSLAKVMALWDKLLCEVVDGNDRGSTRKGTSCR